MAEDASGLPDVKGLETFLNQDKDLKDVPRNDKGQFVSDDPDKGKTAVTDPGEQFKNQDGTINVEALVQAYKGIQGGYTKATQENKTINDQLKQMQEQFEMLRYQQPPQYAAPQPTGNDFDSKFIANPQSAVEGVAEQKARNVFIMAQIENVLQEEQIKNPEEYQERYAYVSMLKNQYPNLVQSAPGVKKLFELADRARQEDLKRKAHQSVKYLFGDDVDMDKLKVLLAKSPGNPNNPNLAYMPDGTLSNRTGSDTGNKNLSVDTQAAVAKGDVDSVIGNVFKEALSRK